MQAGRCSYEHLCCQAHFFMTAFSVRPASRSVRSGHSFPGSRFLVQQRSSRAVTLFFPPVVGTDRHRSGMIQAERRSSSARSTTRPCSYPVQLAGGRRPRDYDARFGRCDVPGGGTHLIPTVPQNAANHAPSRSHALPGFLGDPVGPPRCSGVSFPSSQARDRRRATPYRKDDGHRSAPPSCRTERLNSQIRDGIS